MAEEETPQTRGASKKRKIMQMSEQNIQNLVYNSEAVNTKKHTALAVKMFRDYLMEKELNPDFDAQTLDESFTKFYAEIRNKKGEMYKKTTLSSYRQGIQRHLQSVREDNLDIVKGSEFAKSTKVFGGVVKEMKRQGLGSFDHHPAVSNADLAVLYSYLDLWRSNNSAE